MKYEYITTHVEESSKYIDSYQGFIAMRHKMLDHPLCTIHSKIHRESKDDALMDAKRLKKNARNI